MQLHARDQKGEIHSCHTAKKQANYYCLECGKIVRVRGGFHRQRHFFHLSPDNNCRQNGKSLEHLQTQLYIQSLFNKDSCLLELPFPEIHRIADVVWQPQKIVFEVQCSPIAAEEVSQRNQDYNRAGYQVVWILHEKSFNKFRYSGAEKLLLQSTHYFTNINFHGVGFIYDQYSNYFQGYRPFRSSRLPINLSHPLKIEEKTKKRKVPFFMHNRLNQWKIHFREDLLWHFIEKPLSDQVLSWEKEILEKETQSDREGKEIKQKPRFFSFLFYHLVKKPYLILFNMLLEKMCRS